MIYFKDILIVFVCYIIGCISSGYYITKIFAHKDIREFNSGSTGARNVGRVLGGTGFAITFLLDITRGIGSAWLGLKLGSSNLVITLCMLALLFGHIWPIQLKFQGGKGIAVMIGFLLFFDYEIIGLSAIVFVLALLFSWRYELSMFTCMLATPAATYFTDHSLSEIIAIIFIVIIILIAHRQYIHDFFKHPEDRIS